jgi:AraC-like DNA-binding protein
VIRIFCDLSSTGGVTAPPDAGFGDLSTFNREFRRRYGATPSDVRAAAHERGRSS